jgi:hypothetical protein
VAGETEKGGQGEGPVTVCSLSKEKCSMKRPSEWQREQDRLASTKRSIVVDVWPFQIPTVLQEEEVHCLHSVITFLDPLL